jgi:beta-N-acetylglucosaminidase
MYSDKILSTIKAKNISVNSIRCLMLQSTGGASDNAANFFDSYTDNSSKRYANYVVDDTNVYKYCYTSLSVLTTEASTDFSVLARTLVADSSQFDSPANHISVIEVCKTGRFQDTEKQLVKFCAEFLMSYGLTTDNLWRIDDIVLQKGMTSRLPQYADNTKWSLFLLAVNKYISDSKSGSADPYNNIVYTGATVPAGSVTYNLDYRNVQTVTSIDSSKVAEKEDFSKDSTSSVSSITDKFTNETSVEIGSGVQYEPIYPDLTVPPRASTTLYDGKVESIKDKRFEEKPVLGKPVNDSESYPVDTKIAELELHRPIVHIDKLPNTDIGTIAAHLVELSQRTEKRIVQAENLLSTAMRYLFRLSSRININCQYYGGQSSFDKYKCIRCLHNDLINDAQIVSIDQCLNCSRYEPILGQVYDILDEEITPSLAPILDNIQAARMTMDQYIELTRVEEIIGGFIIPLIDLTKLNENQKEDRPFVETLEKESKFIMDWKEVEFDSQKPDINLYNYDRDKITSSKEELLKPENKYKDGYSDVKKKDIVVPVDGYNSATGIGGSSGGYSYMDQYDYSEAPQRKGIVETARKIVALCAEHRAIYTFGAEIPDNMLGLPIDELMAQLNKTLEVDCSEFVQYCFASNGVTVPDGSGAQLSHLLSNGSMVGPEKDLDAAIKDAMPGDLIFFGSSSSTIHHVGIYVGDGKMCDASTHHPEDTTKDIRERLISQGSQDFYCIARLESLPLPKKATGIVITEINMTLQEMAQIQLKESTRASGEAQDWCTSPDEIVPYLDPSQHGGDKEKFQFLNLRGYVGATADQLKAFLTSKGASADLINNAQAFIDGAQKYNVNEIYLCAHCGLETGWGKSDLSNGSGVFNGKTVYNMYGIGAVNSNAFYKGKEYAYNHSWFDQYTAIVEGANFIGSNYINSKYEQNTLYKMKFNPQTPPEHEYSTDIAWPIKQAVSMYQIYTQYFSDILPKLTFEIPQYK